MEQTLKLDLTKDEATQLSAVLEQLNKVLDESNARNEELHAEIDRRQAKNRATLKQLEVMLNVETIPGYFR